MKNKRNLLMVLFILFAAYFSLHGITYEKAVLENTIILCCDQSDCNDEMCNSPSVFENNPDITNCYDCVDYWSGTIFCWNGTDKETDKGCKYWGDGVITDCPPDPLTVSISGSSVVHIVPAGTTIYTTYTATVNGGDGSNTFSWSAVGATIFSTNGSSCTISNTYASSSYNGSISVSVSSGDGQTASDTKSIYFSNVD